MKFFFNFNHSPSGECSCEAGYSGDKCQYWSECTTDADCNGKVKFSMT